MKNAYLVLSVKDIRVLLAAAELSSKAANDNDTHCIVLRRLSVNDKPDVTSDNEFQIGSHSIARAAEAIIDRVQTSTGVCTLDLRDPDVMEKFCNRHS